MFQLFGEEIYMKNGVILDFCQTNKCEFKTYNRSLWLLVFHHVFSAGFFANEEEASFSLTPGKYSLLNKLTDSLKINNSYVFQLEYPDSPLISWSQTNNPIYEEENGGPVAGYTPIENIPTSTSAEHAFGGLARTKYQYKDTIATFIDGIPGSSRFYFAIGMYHVTFDNWDTKGLPGNLQVVQSVKLWVKVPIYFHCTDMYYSDNNLFKVIFASFFSLKYRHSKMSRC